MKEKKQEIAASATDYFGIRTWKNADSSVNIRFNTSLPHYHSFEFSFGR
jgi:hypothetical protein